MLTRLIEKYREWMLCKDFYSSNTNSKIFYKSKTVWVGIIEIVIGIFIMWSQDILLAGILMFIGVLTILLRKVSKQAIKWVD